MEVIFDRNECTIVKTLKLSNFDFNDLTVPRSLTYDGYMRSRRKYHVSQRRRRSDNKSDSKSDSKSNDNEISVLLTEKYSQVSEIPNIKVNLFPYQQRSIYAMHQLEQARVILLGKNHIIKYNAGILSEPVGSGKTLNALSMTKINRIPKAYPGIKVFASNNSERPLIIRRKFKKFIKSTLIFVGRSVLTQWQDAVMKFYGKCKVFMVDNVRSYRVLQNMVITGSVNNYEYIIVKNGRITVPVKMPDGIPLLPKNNHRGTSIYNLVGNLSLHYCWARVIIDDFDTIGLPANASIINSLFTWYISSTRRYMHCNNFAKTWYSKASEIVMYDSQECAHIMTNQILFNKLNIRSSEQFRTNSNGLPKPRFYAYSLKNLNERYLNLIEHLGGNEIKRITEMINSDSIGEAAEVAGITSNRVSSIFKKMLGSKYNIYVSMRDIIDFIEYLRLEVIDNIPFNDEYKYTRAELKSFDPPEFTYSAMPAFLNSAESDYTDRKNKAGLAIQRVKDNIRHGKCPVCQVSLNDPTLGCMIMNCCGVVLCEGCATSATKLTNKYVDIQLHGRCVNCNGKISILSMIHLKGDFDFDKILDDNDDDDETSDNETDDKTESSRPRSKYDVLIDIVNNITPKEQMHANVIIRNMMTGKTILPEASTRKVIVYANYLEGVRKIENRLKDENIKFWRVMGTPSQINNIAKTYTACNEKCVLIIQGVAYCAGLNLQTTTDIVYFHKVLDRSVESQVAGRGHRIGRVNNLSIHYLLYENELTMMKNTGQIKILDK